VVTALVVGIVLDRRGEQSVDKGSLSEARFASNLFLSDACGFDRRHTIIVKAAPLFATILCLYLSVTSAHSSGNKPLVGKLSTVSTRSRRIRGRTYVGNANG
jgi:hypothetical protein